MRSPSGDTDLRRRREVELAGGLGLGVGAGLLGVLVGVAALARHLVGDLTALVVEQGAATVEEVARLVLGEGEDLGDPLAEVLVRRRPGLGAAPVPCRRARSGSGW